MPEPWQTPDTVEVEWKSFECLGKEEATAEMNRLSSIGAKTMSIHFVGLGKKEGPSLRMANETYVVPVFVIFALVPTKKNN